MPFTGVPFTPPSYVNNERTQQYAPERSPMVSGIGSVLQVAAVIMAIGVVYAAWGVARTSALNEYGQKHYPLTGLGVIGGFVGLVVALVVFAVGSISAVWGSESPR